MCVCAAQEDVDQLSLKDFQPVLDKYDTSEVKILVAGVYIIVVPVAFLTGIAAFAEWSGSHSTL